MLKAAAIRNLFRYDEYRGELIWRVARGNAAEGQVAGNIDPKSGYRRIRINGKAYRADHLVWCYMTGSWPEMHIEHLNHDKTDDRWINLRQITRTAQHAHQRSSTTRGHS